MRERERRARMPWWAPVALCAAGCAMTWLGGLCRAEVIATVMLVATVAVALWLRALRRAMRTPDNR